MHYSVLHRQSQWNETRICASGCHARITHLPALLKAPTCAIILSSHLFKCVCNSDNTYHNQCKLSDDMVRDVSVLRILVHSITSSLISRNSSHTTPIV
jgi:hypothetical protein